MDLEPGQELSMNQNMNDKCFGIPSLDHNIMDENCEHIIRDTMLLNDTEVESKVQCQSLEVESGFPELGPEFGESQLQESQLEMSSFQPDHVSEAGEPEDLDVKPLTFLGTPKSLRCFFCPEISTRGRKVKRTKIHLRLECLDNVLKEPGPSTPMNRMESEESEATQGFHQLCHLLSIETHQVLKNLEIDYLLACAHCTQHLISLKNFIGVFSKVREEISQSVEKICQGIVELGADFSTNPNLGLENAESKLNSFRKAFGFIGDDDSSDSEYSDDNYVKPGEFSHAPIGWKFLTKEALSSKNLYRPVNFFPLTGSDSVIKIEDETGDHGYDEEWSEAVPPMFHCQTKLEPEDCENNDENLEYASTLPTYNRNTRQSRLRRQRALRSRSKATRSRSEPAEPPVCTQCNKTFSRMSGLTYHMRSMHNIGTPLERNYKCNICEKTFLTKSHLVEHFRSHTGEKIYACRYCDARFRGTTGRKGHEETVHGIRDPSFQETCPKCPDKTFTNSLQFRGHWRRMHSEGVEGEKGSVEHSDASSSFIKVERSDPGEDYDSDLPSTSKPKRSRQRSSKRIKRSSSEDPTSSDVKPKKKRQRKKKNVEEGDSVDGSKGTPKEKKPKERKPKIKPPKLVLPPIIKTYSRHPPPLKLKCNFCDRMCARESDRIRHENAVHHQMRPYLCESCGKGFSRIYQLSRHMQSHARLEAGPVECPHCPGKIFKCQQFLETHLTKVHHKQPKPPKPPVIWIRKDQPLPENLPQYPVLQNMEPSTDYSI